MHGGSATQVALVLRGLLGQDVALERLTALDGATRTNAKTLLRAALGLHFGHGMLLLRCPRGGGDSSPRLFGLWRLISPPTTRSAGLNLPALSAFSAREP